MGEGREEGPLQSSWQIAYNAVSYLTPFDFRFVVVPGLHVSGFLKEMLWAVLIGVKKRRTRFAGVPFHGVLCDPFRVNGRTVPPPTTVQPSPPSLASLLPHSHLLSSATGQLSDLSDRRSCGAYLWSSALSFSSRRLRGWCPKLPLTLKWRRHSSTANP